MITKYIVATTNGIMPCDSHEEVFAVIHQEDWRHIIRVQFEVDDPMIWTNTPCVYHRHTISANHMSNDEQVVDAVSYLESYYQDMFTTFLKENPEWINAKMYGAMLTFGESDDPAELVANNIQDWIERHTPIYWSNGEPFIDELRLSTIRRQ